MERFNSIEEFAKTGYESHVALGFFDGVHRGHRAVIDESVRDKGNCRAAALTFAESPAKLLGNADTPLITDNDRKARLMEEAGIDAVIFADFRQIKDMEAEDFITRVLCEQLRAKEVVCGYNYRFGRGGKGDTALLRERCEARGIAVKVKEPVYCGGRAVSSTAVRELIRSGDMAAADRMLGYAYTVEGRIGSGNRLGTQLGFPTINIPIGEGLIVPRFGVYAARITVDGKTYRGATNIGVHPTVGENAAPVCETFLIDYNGEDVYTKEAICEPVEFIRPEKRFADVGALTAQVGRDIERIKTILS